MAIYPCDYAHHLYPQAQQSLYITRATDNFVSTVVLRLCPTHFRNLVAACEENLVYVDDNVSIGQGCDGCAGDPTVTLGVKVFPAKEEMRQFAGRFCDDCATMAGNAIAITSGRPLPQR